MKLQAASLLALQVAAAIAPPVVPPRAGGAHYLIADITGNIISIETTGKRYETFFPDGNVIGHTNHYLGKTLKHLEFVREQSIGSSLARYTALRRYFREQDADLNLPSLQQLTRNHTSYPSSICAHGLDTESTGTRGRTLAAIVHVPATGTTHITRGCACENEFHPVRV